MRTSKRSRERAIFALMFTKRQPAYRGGYWGLLLSGNCWYYQAKHTAGGREVRLLTGISDASRMPQQQLMLVPPPRDIEMFGSKIPVELLDGPAFWLLLVFVAGTVLGLAYF